MEADSARIYIIDETAADDSRTERLIRLARLYAAEEAMPLPQTLCIAKGEYGKPYFENAPWLHFSVYHSGGLWCSVLHSLDSSPFTIIFADGEHIDCCEDLGFLSDFFQCGA